MQRPFSDERNRAIGMLRAVMTSWAVAHMMGFHHKTIGRFSERFQQTGDIAGLPRKGCAKGPNCSPKQVSVDVTNARRRCECVRRNTPRIVAECISNGDCGENEYCSGSDCVCITGYQEVDGVCIPDSCYAIYNQNTDVADGEFTLNNGLGEIYVVYCEFRPNCIYTYVARTNLSSINIGDLYNNNKEILIRHKRTDGVQYEVTYGQIKAFINKDIFISYNSNTGYNMSLNELNMSPYLYVGFLQISEISQGDVLGFQINGQDCTFINCDGNTNTYFALLFNENNQPTTGRNAIHPAFMSKWRSEASPVSADRNLDDEFFVEWEMHFGGCGGYITSDHLNEVVGVTFGLCYELTYSSCIDVYNRSTNPVNGKYLIDNGAGQTYVVYCEFLQNRIYTYVARTDLATINIGDLYNNNKEILIRHKRTDGVQYEVTYGQIKAFINKDIFISYNSNTGYNMSLNELNMSPYLYVGFLQISEISQGDVLGFQINGQDCTFINCDGNTNTYFALLFNENNQPTTGRNAIHQTFMSKWRSEASPVSADRYMDDEFFVEWEMHFGGCGGYITSDHLSDVVGVTFGLCYDLTYSSCIDVYNKSTNATNGKYLIDNGAGQTYVVYCEFLQNRIYTYVARTDLATINIDELYNNNREILIRHKRNDGIQYEVTYGQINAFINRDIFISYNSNTGYNMSLNELNMSPYLYVGFLPVSEISQGDVLGFKVNDQDHTFINCDGNTNTYFALLFNENNQPTTGRNGIRQTFMSKWRSEASPVSADRYMDDEFFVEWEMHFGGCGGYITSDHLSDVVGVTFGLCYDLEGDLEGPLR